MTGAVLGITVHFRSMTLYQTGWAWLPATLLFALGIWLYKMGGANFSLKQLQGQPEISGQNDQQRLVTTGIRARMRHPVYLGHLCEMLAWSIGTGLVVCYGLTALAIFTGAFMIRAEDAELEQRFGEDYRRYRNAVPGFLPKLGNAGSRL
jgi:protein-S-isoprenylcysteine O-methyltransferase Ste14